MASPVTQFPIDPAAEARRMAALFDDFSAAVDKMILNAPDGTPQDQLTALKTQSEAFETISNKFTAEAIGATLQAVQADLANIKTVTAQAKDQLGALNDVAKAISIGTAALNLGTAILAGDPIAILGAVQSIAQGVST